MDCLSQTAITRFLDPSCMSRRQMHESMSLQLEKQSSLTPIKAVAGSSLPGTPGLGDSDGLDPSPSSRTVDEFSAFSSITLQYDGES